MMLWSLFKIVLFVTAVAALTLGASFLLDSDGQVQVTVAATEYTMGPLATVLVVLGFLLAAWLLFKAIGLLAAVLRFLNGDETAISRYFDRNRERRGYEALAEGMMALASGETRVAIARAAKAERYLQRPELTLLLSAQAAEQGGDRERALGYYKRLVTEERTRFVGIHGILKQKLAQGDTDTALKLAEKAFALKPAHEETQNTLFKLQSGAQDWSGARRTLAQKLRSNTLPRDVHTRRDAVLALADAQEKLAAGDEAAGREAALLANRLSPGLVPAAVVAAELYIKAANSKQAAKVLKKAWEIGPHPDLAAGFAAIEPDETPQERNKRFAPLLKLNPDHSETRMLRAELALAAEDFPAARKALGDLTESDPTVRALTLMAAIERGSGASDHVVRGWLAKAVAASRGPQWTCGNCHTVAEDWSPVCGTCEGFDTLEWRTPPGAAMVLPGQAEMLPLIVGALEDQSEPAAEEPTEAAAATPEPEEPEEEIRQPQPAEAVTGELMSDDASRP